PPRFPYATLFRSTRAPPPPRPGSPGSAGALAQALEHAVERVQVAVVDHQPAPAAAAVGNVDPGAQGLRKLVLQRRDVGLLRARPGAGAAALAPRYPAFGELLGAMFDLAHRPAVLGRLGRQLAGQLRGEREQG